MEVLCGIAGLILYMIQWAGLGRIQGENTLNRHTHTPTPTHTPTHTYTQILVRFLFVQEDVIVWSSTCCSQVGWKHSLGLSVCSWSSIGNMPVSDLYQCYLIQRYNRFKRKSPLWTCCVSNTDISAPVECQYKIFERLPIFQFQQFCFSQSLSARRAFLPGLFCETTTNQTQAGGKHGRSDKDCGRHFS